MKKIFIFLSLLILLSPLKATPETKTHKPVSDNASEEASSLLEFLYSISGKYTLTGQHNYPNTRDRNTRFARYYTGKTPVIFSIDWGHAREGDTDSYLARPDIVEECIKQHRSGSLITICWHAVPPTAEEPVTFRPVPGTPADSLRSVQGRLLDDQFKEVLTPGSDLYRQWCKQVDSVAVYLKKLDDAGVPILWRPYHEMNGNWFWWGGRTGEYSTRKLYIQLFDRLVHYHHLTNLVWVWSVDRFHRPDMYYSQYFPGSGYVDVLSLDVYGSDFKQDYYDSLRVLARGKPLALAEAGNPPTPEILDKQPAWTFYATWAGMVRNTTRKQYVALYNDPRILCKEDSTYWSILKSYRTACNLEQLPVKVFDPPDFTGTWSFNEDLSTLDSWGSSQVACKLKIVQMADEITIEHSTIEEFTDTHIEEEQYKTDGTEYRTTFWNSPRITTVKWSDNKDSLIFESRISFHRGDTIQEWKSKDIWTLEDDGWLLTIHSVSDSPWGRRDQTLAYKKEW